MNNLIDLAPWKLEFKPGWDVYFKKFDKSIRQQILNKLEKMKQPLFGRGLHSSNYLVEEVGGYRIAFEQVEVTKTKYIHFAGTHKQYEKWYKGFSG